MTQSKSKSKNRVPRRFGRRPGSPRRRVNDPAQLDFDALLTTLTPSATLLPVPQAPASEPGALDWGLSMRRLLKKALDACPLSVDEVADGLSGVTGKTITRSQIYSWTGQSRPHRFPAELIPAFCAVLGNSILLEGLASACGCRITERQDLQLARLGQLWLIVHHAQTEQSRLGQSLLAGGRDGC